MNFDGCDPIIHKLEQHRVITRGAAVSLRESFMNMCDCAKVYGHFDQEKCAAWTAYAELCFEQNADLDRIELHMYCEDWDIPFYISSVRGSPKIEVYEFPSGNILFSKFGEDGREVRFDKEAYNDRIANDRESLSWFEKLQVCPIKDKWYTMNTMGDLPRCSP